MNRKQTPPIGGYKVKPPASLSFYENSKDKNETPSLKPAEFAAIIKFYTASQYYKDADEAVADALKMYPNNLLISLEIVHLYLDRELNESAENVLKTLSEQDNFQVIFLTATIALRNDDLAKAKRILAPFKDEEGNFSAVRNIILLYIEQKLYKEAYRWLQLGLEKFSDNEEMLAIKAEYLVETNQLVDAVSVYQELVYACPFCTEYWWALAKMHYELALYDKCIESADYGIATDENFGELYLLKGQVFQRLNKHNEAISMFQEALKRECYDKQTVYLALKKSYEELEDWDSWVAIITSFIRYILAVDRGANFVKIDPSSYLEELDFSFCHNGKNFDFAKELAVLGCDIFKIHNERTKAFKDLSFDELVNKALDFFEDEDYDNAPLYLIQAESRANNAEQYSDIADIYLAISDYEQAHKMLTKSLNLEPKSEVLHLKLACVALLEEDERELRRFNDSLDIIVSEANIEKVSEHLFLKGEERLAQILLRHFNKSNE